MSNVSESKIWDYRAYAEIPNDGKRHEIIDGVHYMNPAPNLYHQQISRRLQFQLYSAIELKNLGVVINAPVDVQLSNHNIVQPDLVVVRHANRQIMTPAKVKGIPDLLVEILSPSNEQYDRTTKKELYMRFRVPEYWIVVPDDHEILCYKLDGNGYVESTHSSEIVFDIPPNFTVDLNQIW